MLMDIFFFVLALIAVWAGIAFLDTRNTHKELEKTEIEPVDNSVRILLDATIVKNTDLANQLGQAQYQIEALEEQKEHSDRDRESLVFALNEQQQKNKEVVSQKISHAVRTADMIENIVPLLPNLPYNTKDMHHLAKPLDYLYFDYNAENGAAIVFIEVKTAKAKETPRQKALLKAIKEGRVHYDLLQIDNNEVKITRKT
jgi:predicted Holliday junction resolvase-like endonuclease